jgi:hypothetical protein
MRLSTYLALLFSISLVFYLMGFPTVASIVAESGSSPLSIMGVGDSDEVINDISTNSGSSQNTILGVIFGGTVFIAVGILSLILGFSAIYIIPLLILIGMLNYFVFPIGIIFASAEMPEVLSVSILFFYNFITVMAIITFVRGNS